MYMYIFIYIYICIYLFMKNTAMRGQGVSDFQVWPVIRPATRSSWVSTHIFPARPVGAKILVDSDGSLPPQREEKK